METKKYPIKQVKVYQSVKFEGAENSFFTPSKYMSVRTNKPTIEIVELESGAVLIKSDKDMIKIGVNNVAFIQYDLEPANEKPSEEKGLLKKAK